MFRLKNFFFLLFLRFLSSPRASLQFLLFIIPISPPSLLVYILLSSSGLFSYLFLPPPALLFFLLDMSLSSFPPSSSSWPPHLISVLVPPSLPPPSLSPWSPPSGCNTSFIQQEAAELCLLSDVWHHPERIMREKKKESCIY